LSEKISPKTHILLDRDVKEFIKRLKQILPTKIKSMYGATHWIHYEIDKLAGEKLI